jgi:hypothetical protein
MGVEIGTAHLVSTEEAMMKGEIAREFERAVLSLFGANAQFCSRWFRVPSEPPRMLAAPSEDEPRGSFNAEAYEGAMRTNLLHFAALVMRQSGAAVDPSSFSLPAVDLESIRRQERTTTSDLTLALEEYRTSAARIAQRIESTVARLFNRELGIAAAENYEAHIPNLKSAWTSYGTLSQLQDEVMEIRRYQVAVQIVRLNARHFPAARCANLIDDLETRALTKIEVIISNYSEVPATVSFDSDMPMTIGGQLAPMAPSRSDRIGIFLSRIDVLMARTLGQLAWFTLAACPIPDTQASAR